MTKYTTQQAEDRTIPEGTIATAKLNEVKEVTIPYTDKEDGSRKSFTKLEWFFEIIDGPYAGRKVRGECPAELTNDTYNKFRMWSEALLERTIDLGMEIDPEVDLPGCMADIQIGHKADRRDPSKVYTNVVQVLPISGDVAPPPF